MRTGKKKWFDDRWAVKFSTDLLNVFVAETETDVHSLWFVNTVADTCAPSLGGCWKWEKATCPVYDDGNQARCIREMRCNQLTSIRRNALKASLYALRGIQWKMLTLNKGVSAHRKCLKQSPIDRSLWNLQQLNIPRHSAIEHIFHTFGNNLCI